MKKQLIHDEFCEGSNLKMLFGFWFMLVRYIVPLAIFIIIFETVGIFKLR